MYAIKGSWVGQTFALSKSNESGGRKYRIRRSKEEKKSMVELFIKKYQSLNNGSFPSLRLTHKEVGGSFYTVREIVREVIQENRVLGPGKFLPEEQDYHEWAEQYPLGTISTEPHTSSSVIPNGTITAPDKRPSLHEEVSLTSDGLIAETREQNAEIGKIVDDCSVVVRNVEYNEQKVNDFETDEDGVSQKESIIVAVEPSQDSASVRSASAEIRVGRSLEMEKYSNATGDALQETSFSEFGDSYKPLETEVEVQAIVTGESANVSDAVVDFPALEVGEAEKPILAEVHAVEKEKSFEEVAHVVLQNPPHIEDEEPKETKLTEAEKGAEEVGTTASDNSVKEVGASRSKVFQLEDVIVETFPLQPIASITDADGNSIGVNASNRTLKEKDETVNLEASKEDSPGKVPTEDLQNGSFSTKKYTPVDEKPSKNVVTTSKVGSGSNSTREAMINGSQLGARGRSNDSQFDSNLSNNQVSRATNGSKNIARDIQGSVSDKTANVESSQEKGDPMLERIDIRSWQRSSSTKPPQEEEASPLWAAFQAFVTAFVKFWSE